MMTLFEYDDSIELSPFCGVDEAGRGPLAGDVYAAAVILPPGLIIDGVNDSKKLSEKKREQLFDVICEKAAAFSIATASVAEIDEHNILNATFLAMQRAVAGLSVKPQLALIDGNKSPKLSIASRTIIKGDGTSASIAAASILAKVARDRYMKTLSEEYPQYQFEKHKGYGTKLHYEMLDQYGISPVHRQSFLKKYKLSRTQAQQLGDSGEDAVCNELCDGGYEIIARNWHSAYGEVDIIAKKGDVIAFVEVKTRKEGSLVSGAEAVSASKQAKLLKTAVSFLAKYPLSLQPRFDVAEVMLDEYKTDINYIENAFDGSGINAYF